MGAKRGEDRLFADPLRGLTKFRFDTSVADVFPDMINRSVPGYALIISLIASITSHFSRPDCRYYDLGCSLGAGALSMRRALEGVSGARIVAVDNSDAMLRRAAEYLAADPGTAQVELVHTNVEDCEIVDAAVVLLNFTLQFLPIEERAAVIDGIYRGMCPGGALLLSEKIQAGNPADDDLLIELHHQFKQDQGYSELEISNKRDALETVLIPETMQRHIERLRRAGFSRIVPWFQSFNFVSLLAVK